MPTPKTADALRERIDKGAGSDKVSFPDPAASPLGTDEEAAGNAPTRGDIELAARHEVGRDAGEPNDTAERGRQSVDERRLPSWMWLVFAILIAGGLTFAALAGS